MVTRTPDTGEATAPIVAYATAVRVPRTGRWALKVAECPLCDAAHTHGGGGGADPSYGRRTAHCARGGYELRPVGGAE